MVENLAPIECEITATPEPVHAGASIDFGRILEPTDSFRPREFKLDGRNSEHGKTAGKDQRQRKSGSPAKVEHRAVSHSPLKPYEQSVGRRVEGGTIVFFDVDGYASRSDSTSKVQ